MLTRALQRGAASGWRQSSAHYGGRSWPLFVVVICNLSAVTLFGGAVMLLVVAGVETAYTILASDQATWFSAEAGSALAGYSGISFVASIVPMVATWAINRMYRRRCKSCGR